jgi:hypothetical protein
MWDCNRAKEIKSRRRFWITVHEESGMFRTGAGLKVGLAVGEHNGDEQITELSFYYSYKDHQY